jgi:hypothetical protein
MPKVGNKEFEYNKEGMKKAKAYAKKTGDDVEYKAMGGNVAKYYSLGGRVEGCLPAQNNPRTRTT